jgi:hypothetical protein
MQRHNFDSVYFKRILPIVLIILGFLVAMSGFNYFYHEGYSTGFREGWDEGIEEGLERATDNEYRDIYLSMKGFYHDRVVSKEVIILDTNTSVLGGHGWTSKSVLGIGMTCDTLWDLHIGTKISFNFTFWMNVTHDDFMLGWYHEAIDVFSINGTITVGVDYHTSHTWELGTIRMTFDSTKVVH